MRVKFNLTSHKTKQSDKRYTDLMEYYREASHILFIIILTSLHPFHCILYYFTYPTWHAWLNTTLFYTTLESGSYFPSLIYTRNTFYI
jgi:hypothetical protein